MDKMTRTQRIVCSLPGIAREGEVWITLQVHQNVMAIASLKDLAAVILMNNLEPQENTVRHSNDENIPVLGTSLSTFEIAGKLIYCNDRCTLPFAQNKNNSSL